jgi:hypothetical protein
LGILQLQARFHPPGFQRAICPTSSASPLTPLPGYNMDEPGCTHSLYVRKLIWQLLFITFLRKTPIQVERITTCSRHSLAMRKSVLGRQLESHSFHSQVAVFVETGEGGFRTRSFHNPHFGLITQFEVIGVSGPEYLAVGINLDFRTRCRLATQCKFLFIGHVNYICPTLAL